MLNRSHPLSKIELLGRLQRNCWTILSLKLFIHLQHNEIPVGNWNAEFRAGLIRQNRRSDDNFVGQITLADLENTELPNTPLRRFLLVPDIFRDALLINCLSAMCDWLRVPEITCSALRVQTSGPRHHRQFNFFPPQSYNAFPCNFPDSSLSTWSRQLS